MIPSRVLRAALLIGFLGLLTGVVVNHRLLFEVFAGRSVPPAATPATSGKLPQPVQLAEVRELLAAGALPVDARDAAAFADGHLPGAVSLPLTESNGRLADFRGRVSRERTLVLYCSGYGCPDSFDLALRLAEAGYRDVRVFEGGFPAWRDAGLPVAGAER